MAENNMRILIAEDDLTARTILGGILKKWGYEVVTVKDGLAAWELLQQPDSPRLVILDWIMPGIDGLEVIRRTRAQVIEPQPYIILLTSKDEKGDIFSGLEAGANDYVIKPFTNEELFARIRVGQRTMDLQTRLYETQQTLAHLATHDPLTGIFNRRAILEQLSKELARVQREEEHSGEQYLSVGFFDIDHFKLINDQFGHQTGDEALCGLVAIVSKQIRVYDALGRLGGDEFLIVAPGLDLSRRPCLFDRLISAITSSPFKTSTGSMSLTVSMGVATTDAHCSADQLLETADAAMYQAKREGRSQVVYAQCGRN
jgi:two-component system cell cycle response regulator